MRCYGLYEVLQCSKDASYEDLKRNYHRLVLQHHPDKVNTVKPENNDEFRLIERAWATLRDPHSRREYNEECKQALLESQCVPLYAAIIPDDMEVSPNGKELSYPCRCGSKYIIEKLVLSEENCLFHISCEDCTFIISVNT